MYFKKLYGLSISTFHISWIGWVWNVKSAIGGASLYYTIIKNVGKVSFSIMHLYINHGIWYTLCHIVALYLNMNAWSNSLLSISKTV